MSLWPWKEDFPKLWYYNYLSLRKLFTLRCFYLLYIRKSSVFHISIGGWGWAMHIRWFAWSWVASTIYKRCICTRSANTNIFSYQTVLPYVLTILYALVLCMTYLFFFCYRVQPERCWWGSCFSWIRMFFCILKFKRTDFTSCGWY